jgi:ethylbenzene dehydrogenase
MKRARKSRWPLISTVLVAALPLLTLAPALQAQPKNQLVSRKATAAPATDGSLDAAWNAAPPLTVRALGGKNLPGGATEISLRSIATADTIYFHVQYKDATQSLRRGPWQKQTDGSWTKVRDPNDKGGDNNLYYEDKVGMIWNISSPAFEQRGCMAACHTGEGKPYGNKYLPSADERADIWHLKGVRTGVIGQVDDQYLDGTRYDSEKAPGAGRKNDPKTGGGYTDNVSDDKKMPKFALPGNKPAPPYWVVDAEKEPFDDSKYKAGDEVPGIVVAPFTGDRGDIRATVSWKDGLYTIVMWRKLVTDSPYDVQFSDLRKQYAFGVAVFDNAQVRHAYVPGVLRLVFE